MGSGDRSPVSTRFKREDCNKTKHDSEFSKWQVLIGASDWEDYSQGKEGVPKYRVHSLPDSSGPGVYELGIAVSRSGSGRQGGKLDPDDIVVVYLGQADNVRSRLQCYGRSGAHLGDSYSNGHWGDSKTESLQKGLGLFEDIFKRGYSIVFRWAPMKDKKDAERTESQLLDTFDYAWNKGSNGTRRPDDIRRKLDQTAKTYDRYSKISKKLLSFSQGHVGIKIKSSKPPSPEKSSIPSDEDSKNFLPGIFKFSRFQPRLVLDKIDNNEDAVHICGFIMTDGILCRRSPVPGRKRCEEHRGRRIYGFSTKPSKGNSYDMHHHMYSSTCSDKDHGSTCGVNLGDGTFCSKPAVAGRKRCEEHKGMRVNSSISKPIAGVKFRLPALSSVSSSSSDWTNNFNNASSEVKVEDKLYSPSTRSCIDEHFSTTCGATLVNGSFCRRQPAQGNKRCWQHKGDGVDGILSGINSYSTRSSIDEHFSTTCGATLANGSFCRRQPVQGNKRCWQHKGRRV